MAKVTAHTDLTEGTEFDYNLASPVTVDCNEAGNLTEADGVQGIALFSAAEDAKKSKADGHKYRFPLFQGVGELGSMIEARGGSAISGVTFLRDTGLRYRSGYDSDATVTDEWVGLVHSGTLDAAETAYIKQNGVTNPSNLGQSGSFNELVKIFDSGFDRRTGLEIFCRTAGRTYAHYNLVSANEITTILPVSYIVPMTTAVDTELSVTSPSGAPYSGMTLTLGATTHTINSTSYDFAVGEIEANGGTVQQVYDWWRNLQLSTGDIDSGAGTQRGDIYTGGDLTKVGSILTTSQGLVVKNIAAADASNVKNVDDTGTARVVTFVPTFTVNFVDSAGASTNAPAGARVRIYDSTNANQLYNAQPGVVSSVAVSYTGSGSADLRIEWGAVSGSASASKVGLTFSSINASNVAINITFEDNAVYTGNNYNGVTDPDFSINANKIDINLDTGGGAVNEKPMQELYNAYHAYQCTELGMADSNNLITALSTGSYELDNSVQIANTDADTHLSIVGAVVKSVDGTYATWMDQSGGGTIGYIAPETYIVDSGGGGYHKL